MRKTITAIAASAALAAVALPTTAGADRLSDRHPDPRFGASVVIGPTFGHPHVLGGPFVHHEPQIFASVGTSCVIQHQQFWDGFAWRLRRVRVCD